MAYKNETEFLNPKQTELISVYRSKWKKAVFGNKRVDKQKATAAIKDVYEFCELSEPEIFFCSSPYEVSLVLLSFRGSGNKREYLLGKKLTKTLATDLNNFNWLNLDLNLTREEAYKYASEVERYIWQILGNKLGSKLGSQLSREVRKQLKERLKNPLNNLLDRKQEFIQWRETAIEALESYLTTQKESLYLNDREPIFPLKFLYSLPFYFNEWAIDCCWFDFCISVLKCTCDRQKWTLLQNLVLECGWFYLYDGLAIICDRPTRFLLYEDVLDTLQFSDGFKINGEGNLELPNKYTKQWLTQWYLVEENPKILRFILDRLGIKLIQNLLPEQTALIPFYRQKWQTIKLSTTPIDPPAAKQAITAFYQFFNKRSPQFLFFDSPDAAIKKLNHILNQDLALVVDSFSIESLFWNDLIKSLQKQLEAQLKAEFDRDGCLKYESNPEISQLKSLLKPAFSPAKYETINSQIVWEEIEIISLDRIPIGLFDYCINLLNCIHDRQKWEIIQSVVKNCGSMIALESICLIIDRPIKISFDNSKNSTVIEYKDGFEL